MANTTAVTADTLLEQLWDSKGTDLLLTAGVRPSVRVDGDLGPIHGSEALTPADTERILAELLTDEQRQVFAGGREVDFSFTRRSDHGAR